MTDQDERLNQVRQAADELLPRLTERLARHGLGELEVRLGDLRVRVAGSPSGPTPARAAAPGDERQRHTERQEAPAAVQGPASHVVAVTAPAIGFFAYSEGLGPGLSVRKGDQLGYVEMLGVRHEVRAPRSGTVRNLVTESGEPVEYGQLLIELEPAE
ncbi:MAG TPA: biotin/lipoyl-containing protein [candidate division Zixibacteria bacterium]|nr:biotin/lipoyl-containing protein [candidate division Zixibacteria bacterium]